MSTNFNNIISVHGCICEVVYVSGQWISGGDALLNAAVQNVSWAPSKNIAAMLNDACSQKIGYIYIKLKSIITRY